MYKILTRTSRLSHEEWLQYRKLGVGGSDAGAICGLNPYTSPLSIYLDKTSNKTTDIDNEAMRQGRDLEDYVARRFMEATGLKVRKVNAIFQSKKHPHLLANVDRMIVGQNVGLECKTTNILNTDKWKDGDVPSHYQIQCHHYMAVTGAKAWYIAVVILGKEFKYIRIERDEDIINDLITIENNFWNNHVIPKVLPDPDGSKAADHIINHYFKNTTKEAITLEGYQDKLDRRSELNTLIDTMEKEKKAIEQEIKIAMANAEIARCGNYEILWKSINSSKLDIDKIKLEHPDIYHNYLKETTSRRFTIKVA